MSAQDALFCSTEGVSSILSESRCFWRKLLLGSFPLALIAAKHAAAASRVAGSLLRAYAQHVPELLRVDEASIVLHITKAHLVDDVGNHAHIVEAGGVFEQPPLEQRVLAWLPFSSA